MKKGLDFFREIRYNIEAVRIRRGILIGKEPHWKCGVPQGIVRSSRILSAMPEQRELCSGFFYSKNGPAPWPKAREGALSKKNKLAEWAVLEYHREKWKSSKEQRV